MEDEIKKRPQESKGDKRRHKQRRKKRHQNVTAQGADEQEDKNETFMESRGSQQDNIEHSTLSNKDLLTGRTGNTEAPCNEAISSLCSHITYLPSHVTERSHDGKQEAAGEERQTDRVKRHTDRRNDWQEIETGMEQRQTHTEDLETNMAEAQTANKYIETYRADSPSDITERDIITKEEEITDARNTNSEEEKTVSEQEPDNEKLQKSRETVSEENGEVSDASEDWETASEEGTASYEARELLARKTDGQCWDLETVSSICDVNKKETDERDIKAYPELRLTSTVSFNEETASVKEESNQETASSNTENDRNETVSTDIEPEVKETVSTDAENNYKETVSSDTENDTKATVSSDTKNNTKETVSSDTTNNTKETVSSDTENETKETVSSESDTKETVSSEFDTKETADAAAQSDTKECDSIIYESDIKETVSSESDTKETVSLQEEFDTKETVSSEFDTKETVSSEFNTKETAETDSIVTESDIKSAGSTDTERDTKETVNGDTESDPKENISTDTGSNVIESARVDTESETKISTGTGFDAKDTVSLEAESDIKETITTDTENVIKETVSSYTASGKKETVAARMECNIYKTASAEAETENKETVSACTKETVSVGADSAIKEIVNASIKSNCNETANTDTEICTKETARVYTESENKEIFNAETQHEIIETVSEVKDFDKSELNSKDTYVTKDDIRGDSDSDYKETVSLKRHSKSKEERETDDDDKEHGETELCKVNIVTCYTEITSGTPKADSAEDEGTDNDALKVITKNVTTTSEDIVTALNRNDRNNRETERQEMETASEGNGITGEGRVTVSDKRDNELTINNTIGEMGTTANYLKEVGTIAICEKGEPQGKQVIEDIDAHTIFKENLDTQSPNTEDLHDMEEALTKDKEDMCDTKVTSITWNISDGIVSPFTENIEQYESLSDQRVIETDGKGQASEIKDSTLEDLVNKLEAEVVSKTEMESEIFPLELETIRVSQETNDNTDNTEDEQVYKGYTVQSSEEVEGTYLINAINMERAGITSDVIKETASQATWIETNQSNDGAIWEETESVSEVVDHILISKQIDDGGKEENLNKTTEVITYIEQAHCNDSTVDAETGNFRGSDTSVQCAISLDVHPDWQSKNLGQYVDVHNFQDSDVSPAEQSYEGYPTNAHVILYRTEPGEEVFPTGIECEQIDGIRTVQDTTAAKLNKEVPVCPKDISSDDYIIDLPEKRDEHFLKESFKILQETVVNTSDEEDDYLQEKALGLEENILKNAVEIVQENLIKSHETDILLHEHLVKMDNDQTNTVSKLRDDSSNKESWGTNNMTMLRRQRSYTDPSPEQGSKKDTLPLESDVQGSIQDLKRRSLTPPLVSSQHLLHPSIQVDKTFNSTEPSAFQDYESLIARGVESEAQKPTYFYPTQIFNPLFFINESTEALGFYNEEELIQDNKEEHSLKMALKERQDLLTPRHNHNIREEIQSSQPPVVESNTDETVNRRETISFSPMWIPPRRKLYASDFIGPSKANESQSTEVTENSLVRRATIRQKKGNATQIRKRFSSIIPSLAVQEDSTEPKTSEPIKNLPKPLPRQQRLSGDDEQKYSVPEQTNNKSSMEKLIEEEDKPSEKENNYKPSESVKIREKRVPGHKPTDTSSSLCRRHSKLFNASSLLYQEYSDVALNKEIQRYNSQDSPSEEKDPGSPRLRRRLMSSQDSYLQRLSISSADSLWQDIPAIRSSSTFLSMSREKQKLQEAKFELIMSEALYLRSLNIAVDHFQHNPELHDVLSAQERQWLFSRLSEVRDASSDFLFDLEEEFETDIYSFQVCNQVLIHELNFRRVYLPYVTNQSYQERTFQRLLSNNPRFQQVLDKLESDPVCQRLSLKSFLILPFQRITRLRLLLQNILKRSTPGSSEESEATAAHNALEKLIRDCNESVQRMKDTEELILLNQRIQFECKIFPLISQSRRLVKHGEVSSLEFSNSLTFKWKITTRPVYLHLFNDCLLLSRMREGGRFVVFDYARSSDVRVERCELKIHGPQKNNFRVFLKDGAAGARETGGRENAQDGRETEYIFRTETQSQKLRWILALSTPVKETDLQKYHDLRQVQCLKSYKSRENDELSLDKADIVMVTQKSEDGWMHGMRLSDLQSGWFPQVHVQAISRNACLRNLEEEQRLRTLRAKLHPSGAK
ncbi:extracellular matrix-binding protein ebh [Bombina bombina]|uniref:extracellular matrix-binding protein ebh n=1 Tax=Bombina bombina TaxID=8345 RepID=UPI00235AD962|nr:extracellular matrix-binding protein ebh [Bombina bombina]XP_053548750.1 extracellular matrix-binding protein ebh [Bombina bombina]